MHVEFFFRFYIDFINISRDSIDRSILCYLFVSGYIVCTLDSDEPATGNKVQLTKEFTIFDNSIDPNPVFRSFLLQLLLRTRYDV